MHLLAARLVSAQGEGRRQRLALTSTGERRLGDLRAQGVSRWIARRVARHGTYKVVSDVPDGNAGGGHNRLWLIATVKPVDRPGRPSASAAAVWKVVELHLLAIVCGVDLALGLRRQARVAFVGGLQMQAPPRPLAGLGGAACRLEQPLDSTHAVGSVHRSAVPAASAIHPVAHAVKGADAVVALAPVQAVPAATAA